MSSASPSIRVICRQISLSAAAFFATSDSNATARCASSEQSTTASAIFRMSGSKFVISNNMIGLRRCLTLIDRIVHRGDQALNVGPVERRDERRAQAQKHFAGDAVGFVLKIEYLLEAGLELVAAGDHFAQRYRRFDHHGGVSLEGGEKGVLARNQSLKPLQHRAPLSR